MTETEKARYWRERVMRLSRRELSPLIGYSAESIYLFETGHRTGAAFERYKAACLALHLVRSIDRTVQQWEWAA